PLTVLRVKSGMPARSVVVGDNKRGVIRPTDGDGHPRELYDGAGPLALDDHQLRRSALLGGALRPRRLRLPGRPGGPGLGRARGRPRRGLRAEQVGPDHADGRDDEQPQHREERQLDQREGEWGHRSRGYSLSRRKTSVVRPIVTREPSTSVTRRIGCPFTNEPLVDPRSTRATSGPSTRISAWCRDTPGSTSRRSQSVPRPSNVTGVLIS